MSITRKQNIFIINHYPYIIKYRCSVFSKDLLYLSVNDNIVFDIDKEVNLINKSLYDIIENIIECYQFNF